MYGRRPSKGIIMTINYENYVIHFRKETSKELANWFTNALEKKNRG